MRKILIVDDEEDVLFSLKSRLEREGDFRVTTAGDGEEAWKILQAQPLDLVVLDLAMPKMGGEKLLQIIRKDLRFGELPVIVSTVARDTSSMLNLMDAGATDYLMKPYDVRELIKVIKTYV